MVTEDDSGATLGSKNGSFCGDLLTLERAVSGLESDADLLLLGVGFSMAFDLSALVLSTSMRVVVSVDASSLDRGSE